uniref:Putative secreted protein n=1 Tax=Anopheles darlingi TaxID=43151 RepID=A0A2M4DJX7_ANODA
MFPLVTLFGVVCLRRAPTSYVRFGCRSTASGLHGAGLLFILCVSTARGRVSGYGSVITVTKHRASAVGN